MHTNGTSDCGCGGTLICDTPGLIGLERTRFFPRQLIGPDELTQDQIYFRDKLRRHNRLLHGWGIVCGARVKAAGGCKVEVEAGYVLGPWGDEIVIPEAVTVDLCKEDACGNAFVDCGDVDPWCSDVRVEHEGTVYLAVCYEECRSRPVRVAVGCGCDESECEYSRTRDSYALRVLCELPAAYRPMPKPARDIVSCVGGPRVCPPCPPDNCVVLADITLAGREVRRIDCERHRRYVVSFAGYYFLCGEHEPSAAGIADHAALADIAGGEEEPPA